ncbi:hypothetical protein [Diaminobutyricimonas sp. TR449]|uniref:hypothetical protein n=1 Tax=Diaminobutyricimonas sp. TR449 TaxID=2708076 RepID=UPI0014240429|nr:hypothetical protein [Diaminobutyricimonas sp. TR449]
MTFTEFGSPDDPMLQAWARFRSGFAGESGGMHFTVRVPTAKRESGLWRLIATNNRELGRSFLLYSRFDMARSHVEELQLDAVGLSIEHVMGRRRGSHGWVVVSRGAIVMTCSRWYSSPSTSMASARGALQAFRTAALAAPERNDSSGRRRRTGVSAGADVL